MGWLELPTCCPHCGEPQSIRAQFTVGNLCRAIAEFAAMIALNVVVAIIVQGSVTVPVTSRTFRCKFCHRTFRASPDERNRKRRSPGHCNRCGYDLTGNVSGTCPECGDKL